MSKFLKFIVHFIVICTIACVVGLAVPPFLGITTEIMDDSSKETNLPMGRFVSLLESSIISVVIPRKGGTASPTTQAMVHITIKCTINFKNFDIRYAPHFFSLSVYHNKLYHCAFYPQ